MEKVDFEIRFVDIDDYRKGHLLLYKQSFQIEPYEINFHDYIRFIENQKKNNYHIFVCEEKEKIIASASCFIETKLLHNFGKVAHIEDLIVDENIRNRGLGKKIINHCIHFARENRCYKIILNCNDNNVKFYEKYNFIRKGNEMAIYF
jgi:glucosamine-phosphate N-acetyltransferase